MSKTPLVYKIAYKISGKGIYNPLVKLVKDYEPLGVGVDIGSGYGLAAELISNSFERLYLVDLDYEMARAAKKRLKNHSNVEVIVADSRNVPLPDSFADLVYFFDSLHHMPLAEKALSEAIRITKPSGRLAILDLDGDHPFAKFISFLERSSGLHSRPLSLDKIIEFLTSRNFSIVKAKVDIFGMFDVLALKENTSQK
ncbi:MAG: hypothetical protein DRN92_03890 [Thermoproteota archaeon]|nr:MAG: hypothetical protein DRN92_03890 [Candidatus Korarchaeota archaeon]